MGAGQGPERRIRSAGELAARRAGRQTWCARARIRRLEHDNTRLQAALDVASAEAEVLQVQLADAERRLAAIAQLSDPA